MTFRHSGKLGDVLYALAGLRAVGESTLYLRPGVDLSPLLLDALLPLLEIQPGLKDVAIWDGESFDVDFDAFRTEWAL